MFQRVIHDILRYAQDYYFIAICAGAALATFFFTTECIYQALKRGTVLRFRSVFKKSMLVFLFTCYIYMVIAITLLSRAEGSNDSLNLQLFSTFDGRIGNQIFLIENVILFIPFGVVYGIIWKKWKGFFATTFFACSCSFCIELMQYMTGRGKFEIDDILTNTVGALLGYLCIKVIKFFQR